MCTRNQESVSDATHLCLVSKKTICLVKHKELMDFYITKIFWSHSKSIGNKSEAIIYKDGY